MLIILKAYWVLLLFPLPWLVRWLAPATRTQGGGGLLRVPFYAQVDEAAGRKLLRPRRIHPAKRLLFWLVWSLLIIAAAQPLHVGEPVSINPKARDLMLAVDISDSMKMQDMRVKGEPVDRLTAIKHVVDDFVTRREGDRMGLILFGTRAYVQTPLTFDRSALRTLLQEAQIGMAGPSTAIGDAIGLAIKRSQDHPENSRVLILLTDGANTSGTVAPLQAAQLAAQKNLRIHTIGFGAEEMTDGGIFGTGFMRRTFNPSVDLDEKTLKGIADATGGEYFRARNVDELTRIYQVLDRLEPLEVSPETYRPLRNLFHFPLGLAFLIVLGLVGHTLWQSSREAR